MNPLKIRLYSSVQTGLIVCFLLIIGMLNPISPEIGFAQDQCAKEIEDARQKYFAGQFDQAIVLLDNCIKEGVLADSVMARALRYLTEAYMAKNYIKQAMESIKKLLDLVPNYEPDPVEHTPAYINIVTEAKEELEAARVEEEKEEPIQPVPTVKKGGGKKWLYYVGGAIVGGGAIFLATQGKKGSGNGGTTTTTGFPNPPGRP